jgi:CNT family concentrative nucleoside transporter
MQWLLSLLGIPVLLFLAWLLSTDRLHFPWRVVFWGVGLQLVFAFLILWVPIGRIAFQWFGNLVKDEYQQTFGFQFAFAILPTIIFFSSVMAVGYHLGIMQRVVAAIARVMTYTMKTSGAESLSCSANIFVGQTEAPLLIRPFVSKATRSELGTIMVGGFATIAGGVMAGYIMMGVPASHLLAASVMSAPAAIVFGKVVFPEREKPDTAGKVKVPKIARYANVIDAAAVGASDGVKLAVNVGAMLIAFIALIAVVNQILLIVHNQLDYFFNFSYFPESLRVIFSYIFAPIAWIIGVPWQDCMNMGWLLGTKVSVNEFVAYLDFTNLMKSGALSPRAVVIGTYALCGFANFSSIAIQIGGIGGIAPERRSDLAKMGLRAMFAGALASWQTAAIAGVLIQS